MNGALGAGARMVLLLGLAAMPLALAATNSVSGSRAGTHSQAIGINDLKPNECDPIVLTALVQGSGTVNGGTGPELILGSPGIDVISGGGGDDCIVGGALADTINGGSGNDICLGGPSIDTFLGCETQYQ